MKTRLISKALKPIHAIRSRTLRDLGLPAAVLFVLLLLAACGPVFAADIPVPSIDAGLGPCTVDFTVTDANQEPIYDAKITVRVKYGFLGLRKIDLEIGTNSNGKARFTGLPTKARKPPLEFLVRYHNRTDTVWYWPAVDCHKEYTVKLSPKG